MVSINDNKPRWNKLNTRLSNRIIEKIIKWIR